MRRTSSVYSSCPVTIRIAAGGATEVPIASPAPAHAVFRTPSRASSIARYPVQRHRLPLNARCRSADRSSSSDAAVTT